MNTPLLDHLKSTYADSKILVLGMGREGISTVQVLLKQGVGARVAVADHKQLDSLAPAAKELVKKYGITGYWGESWLDTAKEYEVMFRSPGVSPFVSEFQSNISPQQTITSQTNEFLRAYGAQTIGVTGTKGKSTTASLIFTALKPYFPDTLLLGNIGKPAFESLADITPQTKIVYELSSHQLLDITASPHEAVVLNLYREHLDYYPSFDAYAAAKANILAHQTRGDRAYVAHDAPVKQFFCTKGSGEKRFFGGDAILANHAKVWLATHPGIHPLSMHALLAVTQQWGLSEAQVLAALKDFEGLPHRFEQVGTFAGRLCINDSLATIPQATIAALAALKERSGCLIVGGFDRGQTFETLIPCIKASNFHTIIGMPETGWVLIESLGQPPGKTTSKVNDLREAVRQAFATTKPGEVILLSPAAASFNAFADYAQRGQAFKTFVEEMNHL